MLLHENCFFLLINLPTCKELKHNLPDLRPKFTGIDNYLFAVQGNR